MKQTLIIIIFAGALMFLAFLPSIAQDRLNAPTSDASPTLQATSDWLAKTVVVYGGGGHDSAYVPESYTYFSVDNSCTLSYVEAIADPPRVQFGHPYNYFMDSVPLGAVTKIKASGTTTTVNGIMVPSSISIETGNVAAVSFGNSNGAPATYGIRHYTNRATLWFGKIPPTVPGADIPASPEQMLPRIQKALQHAVDLCRGTYASAPQAKEPF
jgi:hypothetical protein